MSVVYHQTHARVDMLRGVVFALVIVHAGALSAPLTTTCDSATSCSPSWCASVTNSACTFTNSTVDLVAGIKAIPCNASCTAATTPTQCTQAYLNTMFSTMQGVKAAYCTDTFLVVHSDASPNHGTYLSAIPRPPGGGTGDYSSQCVTRTFASQWMSFVVPINVTLLGTSGSNNAAFLVSSDMLYSTATSAYIPLPSAGPCAFALDGSAIFPPFNNVGGYTWESCEMDKCNAHVGQGFDYHYHGDPYGVNCMYNSSSYTTGGHPPHIGFGLDGPWLYGRHLASTDLGWSTALDTCGGHIHDTYAYHYHSQVLTLYSDGTGTTDPTLNTPYTGYIGGPNRCWKGDISKIPLFWDTSAHTASYGSGRFSPGNLNTRTDYGYLQPCCTTSAAYLASGYSLSVTISTTTATSSSTSSPPPPPSTTSSVTSSSSSSYSPPPPVTVDSISATMSAVLGMDYVTLSTNSTKLASFKAAFISTLLTKLNATSVVVNSMVAGSVTISYTATVLSSSFASTDAFSSYITSTYGSSFISLFSSSFTTTYGVSNATSTITAVVIVTASSSSSSGSSMSTTMIIGLAVGIGGGLCLIAAGLTYWLIYRKGKMVKVKNLEAKA